MIISEFKFSKLTSQPKQDQEVEGVLVRKNYNYKIVAPSDLESHAELAQGRGVF